MSNFDDAIDVVLKNEGGYTNDFYDKGGETKYGISKRSYPGVDISQLTLDQAKQIYREDFWDALKLGEVKDQSLATKLLDLAVNIGKSYAVVCVQRALRSTHVIVKEDGLMGGQTIKAINDCNQATLMCALRSEAAGYYRSLNNKIYEKGWLNRAYQ